MIDIDNLTVGRWTYALTSGYIATRVLRFGRDGKIIDYNHENEISWDLNNGVLSFLNKKGELTAEFKKDVSDDNMYIIKGISLASPSRPLVLKRERSRLWPQYTDSTRFHLAWGIRSWGWVIGDHTYGNPTVHEPGMSTLHIGKYTSIAPQVSIALGNHNYRNVSTYPFKTLKDYWPSAASGGDDHITKGAVHIGNDVWIGANSFIASGVTIGDGAIVGAHSVVTTNVPAYAIVAGNPARLIRRRFDDQIIERLQKVAWWSWPEEDVNEFVTLILSNNITKFLDAADLRVASDQATS